MDKKKKLDDVVGDLMTLESIILNPIENQLVGLDVWIDTIKAPELKELIIFYKNQLAKDFKGFTAIKNKILQDIDEEDLT